MKLPKLFYKIFTSGVLGIAIFLLFGTVTANAACISADFAGGDGTQSDPWQITTPAELANVGTCVGTTHGDKIPVLDDAQLSENRKKKPGPLDDALSVIDSSVPGS